ncbi:hypothetical protein NYY89_20835, partial [Acinetobacter baumannii]|nr:hypothetical protein [Acinetobacter baumannii]
GAHQVLVARADQMPGGCRANCGAKRPVSGGGVFPTAAPRPYYQPASTAVAGQYPAGSLPR